MGRGGSATGCQVLKPIHWSISRLAFLATLTGSASFSAHRLRNDRSRGLKWVLRIWFTGSGSSIPFSAASVSERRTASVSDRDTSRGEGGVSPEGSTTEPAFSTVEMWGLGVMGEVAESGESEPAGSLTGQIP